VIKAQVLADFIAEFTPSQEKLDELDKAQRWVIHVDESSTLYTGGIGVVLQSPEGDELKYKVRLQYPATNNEVEFESLLKGLELAKSLGAESILVQGDSQLVMGQVNGIYKVKEERMKKYLNKVRRFVKKFRETSFTQVPREENMEVDALVKKALASELMDEFDEVQYMPSIDLPEVQQIESEENWMTPIVAYLKDGRLLKEKN